METGPGPPWVGHAWVPALQAGICRADRSSAPGLSPTLSLAHDPGPHPRLPVLLPDSSPCPPTAPSHPPGQACPVCMDFFHGDHICPLCLMPPVVSAVWMGLGWIVSIVLPTLHQLSTPVTCSTLSQVCTATPTYNNSPKFLKLPSSQNNFTPLH